ncbi:hypothetical protein GOBAR_AA29588 [Gossypium barbadense]|uniref:Uncharacterized protein n=1 Tax=Gossypium barbadense TaxID=3634 RepID=A0A2P5WJ46_GOSBA|nr:hypothetical protein GOBAR_AA29588 [Gossypium barbadense]
MIELQVMLKAVYTNTNGNMVVRYGRAKIGDKARFCSFDTGVRHARAVKPWTTIHEHGTLTWPGEKRTLLGTAMPYGRGHRRGPRSCGPPLYKQITIHFSLPFQCPSRNLPDPYSQPPPPSRPVHLAASYANISEHLTRFELQCFQQFNNIDATLHRIVSTFPSHRQSRLANHPTLVIYA